MAASLRRIWSRSNQKYTSNHRPYAINLVKTLTQSGIINIRSQLLKITGFQQKRFNRRSVHFSSIIRLLFKYFPYRATEHTLRFFKNRFTTVLIEANKGIDKKIFFLFCFLSGLTFNKLQHGVVFLYPLKTSENLKVF